MAASWTSSSPGVAQVTQAGLVTAQGAGTAVIYCYSGGVQSEPVNVTVSPPVTVVSIAVSPNVLALEVGQTRQLVATATLSDGSTAVV